MYNEHVAHSLPGNFQGTVKGQHFYQVTNGAQTASIFTSQLKMHILKNCEFRFHNIITHREHTGKGMYQKSKGGIKKL